MLDLYQCKIDEILMRRRSLRREYAGHEGLRELRIAVLGGSTTDEFVNLFELLLLSTGFRPTFYQSEFGRFYEDAVLDPQALVDFKPDLVYVHTSCRNIRNFPPIDCSAEQLALYVENELNRFREIWDALESRLSCQVVQNNFETPPYAILGNFDAVAAGGRSRFVSELNLKFSQEIARRPRVILQDVHGLSAQLGVRQWFDWNRYFSYKLQLTPEANLEVARSLASIVNAIYGRSRKVLVLDLDNTLWGGVIGDDGVDKIHIGRETAVAEAYTAFQEYCLELRARGILLAVCSKNTESVAKSGFLHPSSILKLEQFSAFQANWEPKSDNIYTIARELNLGVDSFVFVDDNPAERAIVQAQVPGIAVPDVGSEVAHYPAIIEQGRYFEPLSLSGEDLSRAALYAENSVRAAAQKAFANYGEYLDSLEMVAEIEPFRPVYLERIAQLTNKTNQFNLTTRRYTFAEIQELSASPDIIALYGILTDRFGDNGLISVVLGRREGRLLHMDLWLMSCRVLKRDMEHAMLDVLVERARELEIEEIVGYYIPSAKNGMVKDFYERLSFTQNENVPAHLPADTTVWSLPLEEYTKQNHHIKVTELVHA